MIPGVASQQEKQLMDQLAEVRKAAGADGDDPATASLHALDRLAHQHMAKAGGNFADAYDAVLRTPQGSQLYSISKSQGDAVVVDKAAALAAIRKIGVAT
jgi:hypothetical protein